MSYKSKTGENVNENPIQKVGPECGGGCSSTCKGDCGSACSNSRSGDCTITRREGCPYGGGSRARGNRPGTPVEE